MNTHVTDPIFAEPASSKPKSRGGRRPFWIWWWIGALSLIIGVALVGSISGDQSYLGKPLALTWPILAAVGIFKSTQSIWRSPLVYWGLALIVTTVFGRWFPSNGTATLLALTLLVGGGVSVILWLIFGRHGAGIGLLSPIMKSPLEIPWYRRTRVVALIGSMGVVLLLATIYVSSQNSSNPLADSQANGFLRGSAESSPSTSSRNDVKLLADLMCAPEGVWDRDMRNEGWIGFRCPRTVGGDNSLDENPPLLYMFASSADLQLFAQQAAFIAEKQGFEVVVGDRWIIFGHNPGHADFLRNAINQGGQLVN